MPGRTLLLLTSMLLVARLSTASEWDSFLSRDGVTVSSRKVDGTEIRELRATGVIPVSAERLLAALADIERYPAFMPPTVKAEMLKRAGSTGWFYIVIDPPWVSRRDYCVEVKVSRLSTGELESSWRGTAEACPPPRDGLVRMVRTEGRWRLKPIDASHTFVDYRGLTDPGGHLPAWAANRAAARAMSGMFRSLGEAARDPRYEKCRGESFHCP
jgi:hypothetical protein